MNAQKKLGTLLTALLIVTWAPMAVAAEVTENQDCAPSTETTIDALFTPEAQLTSGIFYEGAPGMYFVECEYGGDAQCFGSQAYCLGFCEQYCDGSCEEKPSWEILD